jgi:hypothetical protein
VRFLGWLLALGFSLAAPAAWAGGTGAGELEYRAPDGCPTSAEFSAEVARRTPEWEARRAELVVAVEVTPDASGLVGRVRFERAGRETVRELHASSCGELVRALALIVAILIDPGADVTPAPPRRTPTVSAPEPPAPPPPAAIPSLFFIAGPELVLQTGVVPGLGVGERLFVALGREGAVWASSARLSATRLHGDAVSAESGAEASFELVSARLEASVIRFGWGRLALEPGLFFELGRLRVEGQHPLGAVTRERLWATAGVSVRPSVTLARRLVLGLALGAHVPLLRYDFAFIGENRLYQNEALGFDAALTLGVRFP